MAKAIRALLFIRFSWNWSTANCLHKLSILKHGFDLSSQWLSWFVEKIANCLISLAENSLVRSLPINFSIFDYIKVKAIHSEWLVNRVSTVMTYLFLIDLQTIFINKTELAANYSILFVQRVDLSSIHFSNNFLIKAEIPPWVLVNLLIT